jgi:RNA polymerase sigma-70 factor (ECF subfamily)
MTAVSPVKRTDLVSAAQSGDRAALMALIERCSGAIARGLVAAGYSPTFIDYEDAEQDALLAIVENFSRADPVASPCGWMHKVARNRAIGRTRSTVARKRSTERLVRQAALDDIAQVDEYDLDSRLPVEELVSLVVGALPPDYRAVVVAYHLDGMPVSRIAEELCIAESAVYTRLRRARKAMLQVLREHGHG